MAACPLHNRARWERLKLERMVFRHGEVDLSFFWEREKEPSELEKETKVENEQSDGNCTKSGNG